MPVDLWVIVLYLAAMLVIGACVSSGARDVEGYTVGNRNVPGWATGLSVLGTFLSSITFLALPATIYKDQSWNAYVFSLALPAAAAVAVTWFVPLYRHKISLSAYEFLEQRLGLWARGYAAFSYVVLQMLRVAVVMLLVALAVEPMLHWGIPNTIIGLGAIVIVYDVVGGIRAVIWTDVLQVIVLLGAALWCVAKLVFTHPGGAEAFLAAAPPGAFSLGEFASWDLTRSTVLVVFIYGLSENLRNYGTDQNYIQRMLCTTSDREAKKSIWIAAISYPLISLLFCLIGTGLWVFYHGERTDAPVAVEFLHAGDGADHAPLPPGTPPDKVFPHYIQHELRPFARGLLIAGILAAAMSTIDSSLNSSSMILFVDVFQRLRRRRHLRDILTLRLTTVALGVIGSAAAIGVYEAANDAEALMRTWWKYAGIAGAGLFGLFLLAWLLPRVPRWGALAALALSVPVLIVGVKREGVWMNANLIGVSAVAAMFIVGAALSAILPRKPDDVAESRSVAR